ncbi:MAG: Lipoprotein signal peptidase [Peptostreptococcus russellii]|uniref:Lipoprotein signal peptidase n=1 Tax=Peptostreptococcus russellii TaxID=215200 RepID=A0A2P7Q073_9FIRM|nr:lipoprotein signal peptidase [Peptostreptococcus russellii]
MYEIFIVILVLLDQVSKVFMQNFLEYGNSVAILDGVFHLTYVENRGAAFGLFENMQVFFIIVAVIVTVVGLVYIHKSETSKLAKISICLIIAGAIGNLIDRVKMGYVVDFFDFRFIWNYVFNIADVFVVIGTLLLCIYLLKSGKEEN